MAGGSIPDRPDAPKPLPPPPSVPPTNPDPWRKYLPYILIAIVAIVVIGALVSDSTSDGGSDTSQQEENSQEVCGQIRAVADDADVLTPVELRERIQEIHEGNDIVLASIPIQNAVREMLATITANDVAGFEAAVDEMIHQCELVGA